MIIFRIKEYYRMIQFYLQEFKIDNQKVYLIKKEIKLDTPQ